MVRRVLALLIPFALLAAACSDDTSTTPADDAESPAPADAPADDASTEPEPETEPDGDPTTASTLEVIGRAHYVTGGDVLLRYSGDGAADLEIAFDADGAPLEIVDSRPGEIYLVAGLPEGSSVVNGGGASVEVTNYPITGPVFSGPHQEKLFCALDRFGLTPTGDDDCSAETLVRWGFIGEEGFVETEDVPAGSTVVRLEQGTINRGIYSIAVADPSFGAEPIEAGKNLIYTFGGGCGNGHTQAPGQVPGASVLDESALAAGYVLATSTFNIFQAHCNDVLSAETLMMTQERVNELLGPINLTIGRGGSGGAIQQYAIVQNYPGLLDAVNASVSFPDSATISGGVTDCGLLINYYDSAAGAAFTPEQRLAINGHGSAQFCRAWAALFLPGVYADRGCDSAVPAEEIYDAETNPTGIRCTLQDSASNLFGVDENGFGRRPLDNVGIEYGRNALNAGVISVDQFLDLNEAVGGYDLDGNIVDERTAADPEVIELTYAKGRVLRGDSGVADVPIIDVDLYSDLGYDIHDRFRLFTIRARLTGDDTVAADNRAIFTRGGSGLLTLVSGGENDGPINDEAAGTVPSGTDVADWLVEWATTGERPEGVADDCIIDGARLAGDGVFDAGEPCAEAYPYFGDPRTAAGQDIVNDIIKCTTKDPSESDYDADFDDAQWDRLVSIFPDGVCDYSVAGVGQVPLEGTWLEY